MTECEAKTLEQIKSMFVPAPLALTVAELAQVLRTSPSNIAQKLKRGQLPFNFCRMGARYLFPCASVAQWLCGGAKGETNNVCLEVRKSTRANSASNYKRRLMAFKLALKNRAHKLQIAAKQNDAQAIKLNKAKEEHAQGCAALFNQLERLQLIQLNGLKVGKNQNKLSI